MEKEMYIDVKNCVREKSGLYYAVMIYKNIKGERREKWFPTQLPVKGNKTKAEAVSCKILREFKIPREDLCLHEETEDIIIDETQPIEPQLLSSVLEKDTTKTVASTRIKQRDLRRIYTFETSPQTRSYQGFAGNCAYGWRRSKLTKPLYVVYVSLKVYYIL